MVEETKMNYEKMTKAELIQMLRENEPKKPCKDPYKVWELCKAYGRKQQEHFIVILLDGAHHVIKQELATIGLVNRTLVHPREVFAPALINRATAVILCHNHPSGNLEPSADDMECTSRLRKAGALLGIEVLDHVIIGKDTWHSMMEHGEMC